MAAADEGWQAVALTETDMANHLTETVDEDEGRAALSESVLMRSVRMREKAPFKSTMSRGAVALTVAQYAIGLTQNAAITGVAGLLIPVIRLYMVRRVVSGAILHLISGAHTPKSL
jgi:hypothetical protein